MSSKDRERRLARERYERQQQRRAQARRRARRRSATIAAAVVVAAVVAGTVGISLLTGGNDDVTTAASPSDSSSPSASAPSPSPTPTTPKVAKGECAYTKDPASKSGSVGLPPKKPVKGSYTATIATNRGSIRMALLGSQAPCTVNSFVFLAKKGFFNSTHCHRLVATAGNGVLQCGDPTGTGSGGPGYSFADENLVGAKYVAGTVAMANAGPNTNGSQFFLTFKPSAFNGPHYTPFARITSGLSVLQAIAKTGSDNSEAQGAGKPKKPVTITSVRIAKA